MTTSQTDAAPAFDQAQPAAAATAAATATGVESIALNRATSAPLHNHPAPSTTTTTSNVSPVGSEHSDSSRASTPTHMNSNSVKELPLASPTHADVTQPNARSTAAIVSSRARQAGVSLSAHAQAFESQFQHPTPRGATSAATTSNAATTSIGLNSSDSRARFGSTSSHSTNTSSDYVPSPAWMSRSLNIFSKPSVSPAQRTRSLSRKLVSDVAATQLLAQVPRFQVAASNSIDARPVEPFSLATLPQQTVPANASLLSYSFVSTDGQRSSVELAGASLSSHNSPSSSPFFQTRRLAEQFLASLPDENTPRTRQRELLALKNSASAATAHAQARFAHHASTLAASESEDDSSSDCSSTVHLPSNSPLASRRVEYRRASVVLSSHHKTMMRQQSPEIGATKSPPAASIQSPPLTTLDACAPCSNKASDSASDREARLSAAQQASAERQALRQSKTSEEDTEAFEQLHLAIKRFADFCVSDAEQRADMRSELVSRAAWSIHSIWPLAIVELVGSVASDVALPKSDVDLCVYFSPSSEPPVSHSFINPNLVLQEKQVPQRQSSANSTSAAAASSPPGFVPLATSPCGLPQQVQQQDRQRPKVYTIPQLPYILIASGSAASTKTDSGDSCVPSSAAKPLMQYFAHAGTLIKLIGGRKRAKLLFRSTKIQVFKDINLIRLRDGLSGVSLDIWLPHQTNVVTRSQQHTKLIKQAKHQFKHLFALVAVVKSFMVEQIINSGYSGLGSYGVLLMVLRFLQQERQEAIAEQRPEEQNLGRLLCAFFRLWIEFDYVHRGVSVQGDGAFIDKPTVNLTAVQFDQPGDQSCGGGGADDNSDDESAVQPSSTVPVVARESESFRRRRTHAVERFNLVIVDPADSQNHIISHHRALRNMIAAFLKALALLDPHADLPSMPSSAMESPRAEQELEQDQQGQDETTDSTSFTQQAHPPVASSQPATQPSSTMVTRVNTPRVSSGPIATTQNPILAPASFSQPAPLPAHKTSHGYFITSAPSVTPAAAAFPQQEARNSVVSQNSDTCSTNSSSWPSRPQSMPQPLLISSIDEVQAGVDAQPVLSDGAARFARLLDVESAKCSTVMKPCPSQECAHAQNGGPTMVPSQNKCCFTCGATFERDKKDKSTLRQPPQAEASHQSAQRRDARKNKPQTQQHQQQQPQQQQQQQQQSQNQSQQQQDNRLTPMQASYTSPEANFAYSPMPMPGMNQMMPMSMPMQMPMLHLSQQQQQQYQQSPHQFYNPQSGLGFAAPQQSPYASVTNVDPIVLQQAALHASLASGIAVSDAASRQQQALLAMQQQQQQQQMHYQMMMLQNQQQQMSLPQPAFFTSSQAAAAAIGAQAKRLLLQNKLAQQQQHQQSGHRAHPHAQSLDQQPQSRSLPFHQQQQHHQHRPQHQSHQPNTATFPPSRPPVGLNRLSRTQSMNAQISPQLQPVSSHSNAPLPPVHSSPPTVSIPSSVPASAATQS